jgi:hypothetical protein
LEIGLLVLELGCRFLLVEKVVMERGGKAKWFEIFLYLVCCFSLISLLFYLALLLVSISFSPFPLCRSSHTIVCLAPG